MRETKFTLNALLLVVLIFSAITFFFTVKLYDMASRRAVNDFYPIEETPYAVRYSSLQPNGIYEGGKTTGVLRLEGLYGYDWGATEQDGVLYLNEYRRTDIGLLLSDVVRVDTRDFRKETLLTDAMLRGRCASGELVCLSGAMVPADYPKTNPLCRLYAAGSRDLRPESDRAEVIYLDPQSGEILFRIWDEEALGSAFEERYLARTLQEVMG